MPARVLLALLLLLAACADGGDPAAADTGGADTGGGDAGVGGDASADLTEVDEGADAGPDAAPDAGPEPDPSTIGGYCEGHVGEPRVEEVAPDLFVAIHFDLANTILVRTSEGHVVIDVGMSPTRSEPTRAALEEAAGVAPIHTIIYTHSHIDHIGGASVWAEEGTQIIATDAFMPHFLKQYGAFRVAETIRGGRQFGVHVAEEDLPCSALGRRADVLAALSTGFMQPTMTFTGAMQLTVGGVTIDLVEAHGETHDQLFVWLPELDALMPGDNFYEAFPNLYTIRGTAGRPIDRWIASLDAMRARDPGVLVPSHTEPVIGKAAIRAALRDYRDAIQWLYDEVVRAANALEPLPHIVERVKLPGHLAGSPYLDERYGQVDWSVRAIYQQQLGWFDGRANTLYPPPEVLAREIELMGGAAAVLAAAESAVDSDPRWAAHLLGKLRDAEAIPLDDLAPSLAAAYRGIGATVGNTNGRGYLLERAWELEGGVPEDQTPEVGEGVLAALPLDVIFAVMTTRVIVEETLDVHETLAFEATDLGITYYITVRRGVAEIVAGEPLPETPEPVATLQTASSTWVAVALQALSIPDALAQGLVEADDFLAVATFLAYFQQGL